MNRRMVTAATVQTETANEIAQPTTLRRFISPLVWVITVGVCLFVPLKILGDGYLPMDDALRHAAKVVSGRSWSEIMVLADWVKLDHHAGWHTVLGAIYAVANCTPDILVAIAVFGLFSAFCLAPLVWIKRPEVWLSVLLVLSIAFPTLLKRLTYGRPLILSAAILMTLLLMWHRKWEGPRWKRITGSVLLFGAAAWIHGSWCLFVLPVLAFALTREWHKTAWLGFAWVAGSLLAGVLTGHPITFLCQSVQVIFHCFPAGIPAERLAIEFRSSGGDRYAFIVTSIVIVWRRYTGTRWGELVNNAPFMLAVLGFVLGLKTMRFWLDWGLPALLCWLALQLEEPIRRRLCPDAWPRLVATAAIAAMLFFTATSNSRHGWTDSLYFDYVSANDPKAAEWLPQEGGIVYHPQQSVFYRLFFTNPHANWHYVMGFEPTFMTDENFATYRRILDNPHAATGYEPWVNKMRAADRLIIERAEPLPIPQLEWKRFGRMTWIGRRRQVNEGLPVR